MKILKTIIYHLFLALRGIFFVIFNFIAGLLALGIIISLGMYFLGDNDIKSLQIAGSMFIVFLIIYFVKHFYDKIIFWAKPDDIDLTLFK